MKPGCQGQTQKSIATITASQKSAQNPITARRRLAGSDRDNHAKITWRAGLMSL